MKIFILEPTGHKSDYLFQTMEETFRAHGHEFIGRPDDADVIFYDLWNIGGIYCRRDVEKVLFWQKPVVYFDFKDQWGSPQHRPNWWGFDDYKILNERATQDQRWAVHLREFLEAGLVKVGFMRKMAKSWEYPSFVKPIECVMYPGHDFEPVTQDSFAARKFDVCFIGNATPWRANAATSLALAGINADFFFPFHRLENDEWLSRHANARMFLEADGGGFGSERPYQLATIAPMLKVRNDQHMAFPWTDGENCIEVGDQWGSISEKEAFEARKVFINLNMSYGIYLNGIAHLHAHYTPEARSLYILDTLKEAGIK